MDALWKWIAEAKVNLSALERLPIIPQLPLDDFQQEGVTLLEVSKSANMCRLSTLFSPRERTILTCIMKKLDFLIIDESKMPSMKHHPDFEEFVPELLPNSELIIKYFDSLSVTSRLQAVQRLDADDKDFLRKQFYNLYDSCAKYQSCLRSIPIYHAACSNVLSPLFIALSVVGSTNEAFLLSDSIPPLPEHPSNMLCPIMSPEEGKFFEAVSVKQLSLPELCTKHLIPSALQHIQNCPDSWSVGDDLVLWILKQQQKLLRNNVIDILSQQKVVYTRNSTHKMPQEIYDPQDQTLAILFDVETDKDHFPCEQYLQEAQCKKALLTMGMKTWDNFQGSHTQMCTLLQDRMKSIYKLRPSTQLIRGQFILQTLAEPNNYKLQEYASLNRIQFLKAEVCPELYPSCLRKKWYGQQDKLYGIEELCSPDVSTHSLVGTVRPILSQDYCLGQHAVSTKAFEKLAFQKVTEVSVLNHLENLRLAASTERDAESDKIDQIVMSVYQYLDVNSPRQKLPFIWWRDVETFIPASKFILHPPENLLVNLEPFYYSLRAPIRKYAHLFELHGDLTPTDVAGVVRGLCKQASGKLTSQQVVTCVSILNWLCEKQYQEPDMLMLTEECTLMPTKECVFDDRNWMKHSKSKGHIKAKSLLFVHDQIPQKVAKHFQVTPLSRKVAPSQKLGISYTKAGQHEGITQRIRHIVQEYETNIDIFKELIQNADDAGATEVKFLVDWRCHPTESLITKELKEWQGPALIVYNNATFSDEDFDNVCKVAGETKKSDPLKTGRFGVGFCATYHLTDLPSFISRRFFTMFDPHTSYLGAP